MSQGDNWLEGSNPPSQGMSGGTKVLLGFLLAGGFCVLACCGIAGFAYYKFKQAFDMTVTPAEVEARAQEIVQFKAPARFKPAVAMKMDLGQVRMNMATYQLGSKDGSLTIVESSMAFEQAKDEADDLQEKMKQARREKAGQAIPGPAEPADKEASPEVEMAPAEAEIPDDSAEKTTDEGEKTEIKERVIRGQKVQVKYSHGFDPETGRKTRSMNVVIPGKTPDTSAIITLEVPEADWNDAEVQSFLDSIQ
ncbi:MAG: hypothetical protein IT428_10230 [Planctomycetaceae bacterium]|nr:hypothetical protein [Planctomycetaceae bacterium]